MLLKYSRFIGLIFCCSSVIAFGVETDEDPQNAPHAKHHRFFDELSGQDVAEISTYRIPGTHSATIYSLYVMPERRGEGIAQHCLHYAMDLLSDEGYQEVYLQIYPYENETEYERESSEYLDRLPQLQHLYNKMGFRPLNRWEYYRAYALYWWMGFTSDPHYLLKCRLPTRAHESSIS